MLDRNTPGPGYYNPNERLVREGSPAYRIDGNAERLGAVSKDQAANPGPGSYEKSSLIGGPDSKRFTIG